jgi:glycosyltransferase involved in cell wall biosynthesis
MSDKCKKQISFIIPCFNEALNIDKLFETIQNELSSINDYNFNYYFIDDGSTDETWKKISMLKSENKKVYGLKLSRNFGKENALLAGIENAEHSDGYLTIDADLQDDPTIIKTMLIKFIEGSEIVYGQRISRYENPLYIFFTTCFYFLMSKYSKIKIPENVSDFYLFSEKVRSEFLSMKESVRYTRGLIFYTGFKSQSVKYHRPERKNGKSSFNFFKLVHFAVDAITGFTNAPLHLISIIGLIIAVLTFLATIIYILSSYIFRLNNTSGWSSIVLIVSFFGSLQLVFLSIIAEYVARISIENKNRSKYIISEKL